MPRTSRLPILLITLWAAFTRWHALDQTRTLWDDAYPMAQALRMLAGEGWPQLGQQATFFFNNPPGQEYLILLPVLAFGSLWGVFWWTAALNVLAVPALYRLGRLLGDERLGLIAAFLFATSPWVLLFSRQTAAKSLTPVAATLVLALLIGALARRDARRLTAAAAVLAVYIQTYTLGLLVMPVQAVLVLATRWRHIPGRAGVLGAALVAISVGSYALALASDWEAQAGRLLAFSAATEGGLHWRAGFTHLATIYVTGREYLGQTAGRPPGVTPAWLAQTVEVGAYGMQAMLVIGLLVAGLRWWRRAPHGWAYGAVLLWWLTPLAMLSVATRDPFPWHAMNTLPAGHLLAAVGVHWLWGRRRALTPVILALAVGYAALAWLSFDVDTRFNRAYPVHPARTDDALDRLTLAAAGRVGAAVREAARGPDTAAFFAQLPDPTLAAWTGLPGRTVSWFSEAGLWVAPLEQPAVYVRLARGGPLAPPPYAERVAAVDLGNADVVVIDRLPAWTRAQAAALPAVRLDWPSEAGRTLLGYTWEAPPRPGQTVTLLTFWLIENVPPDVDEYLYGPYLHLNAPGGGTIVNVNGLAIEGYFPRPGDLLLQPIIVPVPADLPPGDYGLELGLYDGVHQVGTTFFPPGGVPQPFYTEVIAVGP